MEISQYQIILVNLDPTIGSEIKKTRPCVVVSPNEMNKYLNTLVIAPITSRGKKNYPSRILLSKTNTKGWVVLDQIRTIDKQRVVKVFESLSDKEISKIKSAIKEAYVD
jgi:mRNA interferase MazF